ncbi:MAG TPA: SH3 domain-containing protein [Thermomicrobiales bacterium]|nr:SH3 domain-containing protein [Thermomicrobiales bacterium]
MDSPRRFNRRTFLLGSAGAAAVAFVPAARHAGAQTATYPVGANILTNAAAWLRSGPGLSHSVIVTLWNGAPMQVTGAPVDADGYTWYPIRTGYGTEGWIADVALTSGEVSNPAFPVGSTAKTTAALRIRSGAGQSYPVIVTLWVGAPVTITGTPVSVGGFTWYPIRTGYGTEGWVAGEYLTK